MTLERPPRRRILLDALRLAPPLGRPAGPAAHACSLENVLQRRGCVVDVQISDASGNAATCVVSQEMAPTWENIRETRQWLTDVATELGGSVHGWEAAVRSSPSDGSATK
jgi:hypothetical protein